MTKLSYNFLSVPDTDKVLKHLTTMQAGGGVFFPNQIDFARDVKKALPQSHVVIRMWPDEGAHLRLTPDQWIDLAEPLGAGGLIVQTVNESGFDKNLMDWHVRLMKRLRVRGSGLKVGVLGLNVGTPDPSLWYLAEELLREMALMSPGQAFMILHEYYGLVVTSGFIGSHPQDTRYHPDYAVMANWPDDPRGITKFHVGRFEFLKQFCEQKRIPCPPIIIGEHGTDFTGDIGAWLASKPSSSGYNDIIDGWRDCWATWGDWYPGVPPPVVYGIMTDYALDHIYQVPEIVGVNMFAFGTDGKWDKYRTDPEMTSVFESLFKPPVSVPTDAPPGIPIPPIVMADINKVVAAIVAAMESSVKALHLLGYGTDGKPLPK